MNDPQEMRAWLLGEARKAQLDDPDEATRSFARGVVETCLRVGAQFGLLTALDQILIRHRVALATFENVDERVDS